MAEQAYTVASDGETVEDDRGSSVYPEIAIGIDIGTFQSSVAVWNGSQVDILKNTKNQKMWRSYVTFKDEIPSSGVTNQISDEFEIFSGSAIFNMKRLIGRADTDPVVHSSKTTLPFLVQTLNIGTRPFLAALVNNVWKSTTPEEVLAVFLVDLRVIAELQLKRAVRNVVLTVPVSFSRFQLTRIERACAMAGLFVLRLMPEPTAVALLYGQHQQQTVHDNMGSGSENIAIIFNMGAGYCDVCVSATAGGVSQIKALSGSHIGGEDIVQNIMHHLLPNMDSLFLSHGNNEMKAMGLLRVAAQDAVIKLSSQDIVMIDVDLENGLRICKVLGRPEFEEVNRKVFEKCESLVEQCLFAARVDVEDISDVILVGGCSNIPKVKSLVLELCKKDEAYMGMDPLEAVVCGAALEGAVASGVSDPLGSLDLLTIQATPQSLGIEADGHTFVPIIPRNMTMPARKEMWFTTTRDNQTEALIVVYEGEGKKVDENRILGYFKIMGIPSAPKGIPEISVCMDLDASNVLRVFAGAVSPQTHQPVMPFLEVRMPTVDDGHGWCAETLVKMYGSALDLSILQKKMQQ
ncbi:hypothetical protein GIB67_029008 [Kingdonia uniflora]|uniref:Heat shock 70 kDa protein 8 n=1 Tax=Kingdonia uniflora TaxID=39325 RepID=A0A7J7N689_9MAGN|nr:hypothetical protein GIB67_029008 [Kingdonia uniflora]